MPASSDPVLTETLAAAGHQVRTFDALLPAVHPSGQVPGPGRRDVEFVLGDVRDAEAMDAVLRGVDAVCHQAAMVGLGLDFNDAPLYVGCNDLGTAVLLAAMSRAGVGSLVLASSMVVYGEGAYTCTQHGAVPAVPRLAADLAAGRFEPACGRCGALLVPGLVGEDAPLDPRSVYAASKVAQEHLAAAWARATGGRAIALRYHNVYGPGMPRDTPYAGVASFFRSALAGGQAPRVFEDGGQRRDFVHVRDVAEANLSALAALSSVSPALQPGALRVYNVGSDAPRTVWQLAAVLAEACGGPPPVITGSYRLGDVRHLTASSELIATELGWRAEVPFDLGVTEFAAAPLRGT